MKLHEDTPVSLLTGVLHGKRVSRPPCICPGGMMNMLSIETMALCETYWPDAHTDPILMAKLAAAPFVEGLFDNIGVPFCMTVEAEALGAAVDLGNRQTEPRVAEYLLSSVEQWPSLAPVDCNRGRMKVVLEALSILHTQYPQAALFGNLTGPISLASSLVDANTFYKELRKKPDAAHKMMDFLTDNLISFGRAQIQAGAQFIAISDPSGTGEILGPRLFDEYALPCLNRLCRELRPYCNGVIVHICGQLHSVYSQLSRLESDAISVDAAVSLEKLRENVPGKPVMGNVSTFALAGGKSSAIRSLCKNALHSGANILAPACGLGTTTSLDSIRILMETAKEAALYDE